MDKLPEMERETFWGLLRSAGMPPWAAWLEVSQAEQEIPGGTPEQLFARAYHILYHKFGKPGEGA